ncbi:hypothetical protein [Chamaesiphon sp.]|uniref:hypothetical protein n=1 Tax=Chamaesiphon sp. TaxID=2814140 RepID=UPI003593568A
MTFDSKPDFYTAWNREYLIFLKNKYDEIILANEDIDFLSKVGLPKHVNSLEIEFNLDNVEVYSSNFDNTQNISLPKYEKLYKIGCFDNFGNGIAVQESNRSVYIIFSHGDSSSELIERGDYFNLNIICFAKCLNIYEEFFKKHQDSNVECKSKDEKHKIMDDLESSLKAIDSTIISSQSRIMEYDNFWAYVIEDWYHELDLCFVDRR